MSTKHIKEHPDAAQALVRETLEPDQLAEAKGRLGRRRLTKKTMLLLWGLRFYVGLMVLLIAFQIWNALHGAS